MGNTESSEVGYGNYYRKQIGARCKALASVLNKLQLLEVAIIDVGRVFLVREWSSYLRFNLQMSGPGMYGHKHEWE
jgi:hypothetical protein